LGRKNWIHVGSQQAGPKICRRMKIPIRDYLAAVLAKQGNPFALRLCIERLVPVRKERLLPSI